MRKALEFLSHHFDKVNGKSYKNIYNVVNLKFKISVQIIGTLSFII